MSSYDNLNFGETLRGLSPSMRVFAGRYELVRKLGRGGMGEVWLAKDLSLELEVALKFLPELLRSDAKAIADLKRETRRSLQLTHVNIVRIYDFCEDERFAAISMEYVKGKTLSELSVEQDDHFFEVVQIQGWIKQLCSALNYAHIEAKIVHRDLKPGNLMIDHRGNLKVADFGVSASITDSVSRVSVQASSSGTPVYMSPQQMMGEKASPLDDIYALGALIYELLTGKPPFYTGNIFMQVNSKVPPGLSDRREELDVWGDKIPQVLEELVAACLAKDVSERPESVEAVSEFLNPAARSGEAPSQAPEEVDETSTVACPECESLVRSDARFCSECGAETYSRIATNPEPILSGDSESASLQQSEGDLEKISDDSDHKDGASASDDSSSELAPWFERLSRPPNRIILLVHVVVCIGLALIPRSDFMQFAAAYFYGINVFLLGYAIYLEKFLPILVMSVAINGIFASAFYSRGDMKDDIGHIVFFLTVVIGTALGVLVSKVRDFIRAKKQET